MDMQQKKRKHLSEEQKEVMISFMETHGDISTLAYTTLAGREKKKMMMEELTNALNSCKTGVIRTPKEWIKSWSDNKNKTKSKATAISRHFQETGCAPTDIAPLTSWEERIIGLGSIELIQEHAVLEVGFTAEAETKPIIEVIEVDNMPKIIKSVKQEPSEYEMTDPLSSQLIQEPREETISETTSAPPPTSSGPSKEKRTRKRRVRRQSEYDEHFMRYFITSQKQTNSAILELASAIREGCKMIAESCNNIAKAHSQNQS